MVHDKILIAVITGQTVARSDFYDNYIMLDKENCLHALCHNRSPADGRNLMIDAAKKADCTHILFIDDDMAFEPDALKRLVAHDKDIVSGLYLQKPYPHVPLAFDLADKSGAAFPMYLTDEPGLVPIVAAGFGFLLIKMTVFDKLEEPYVRLGELNPTQWCDDIGFFKRVREAGIQSYCDTSVLIGHMGPVTIWPYFENGQWYSSYDTGGSGRINTPHFAPDAKYEFVEKN